MATASPHRLADLFVGRATQDIEAFYGPSDRHGSASISFAYGFAAPELFPRAGLLAATAAVLEEDAPAALNYGPTYGGLVEQIVERLRRDGVEAEPEQVLVTHGSSQVLGLLPQVFVAPGDVVIVEGPTFLGAIHTFAESGARIVSVPTDAAGMDVDALEATLAGLKRQGLRPKFIYTIPTFHNPSGVTMSLERRQRLVALGAEYGVLIVEDDAYGDLRFEGQALPNLAALDSEGWVMRVSTYSKILAPGIRMGWAYARPEVIRRLQLFKVEGGNGPLMTRVIARYCANGRLEAHIQELIALYRHKRDVMLAAIADSFPADVVTLCPEGGFFIWCKLPADISATALLAASVARGVSFTPGTRCFAGNEGDDAIRLAFSFVPAERIAEGIAGIGAAMRDLRGR